MIKNCLLGDWRLATGEPLVSRAVPPPPEVKQVGSGAGTQLGACAVHPSARQYAKVAPVSTVPGKQCQTATSPQFQQPLPDTLPFAGVPGWPQLNVVEGPPGDDLFPPHCGRQSNRASAFGPTLPAIGVTSSGRNPSLRAGEPGPTLKSAGTRGCSAAN